MHYPRILAAIRSAKWAVTPVTLQAINDALTARLTGRVTPRADDRFADSAGEENPEPPYEMIAPGVARVKLHGIIGKNLSGMEMSCGGCDIARVEDNLSHALASDEVASVVLDIDSPGGTVTGVADFAARLGILQAAMRKRITAYASGQCCSAAYWIATGCDGLFAGSSSDVGSIGVYIALVDQSENWKTEGYKLVLIKAGEHKAAGIAGSTITPEQVALWQADVDFIYAQFTGAVRAARPGLADAVLQGQTFYGPRALEAGLVDDILTLEEVAAALAA